MDLNEVAVYIKVVQAGSFSAAAKQLQMPNSTVSAKVSALEARLGTTLIQRTTRKLNVTPAGQAFFQRALSGLDQILAAESELLAHQVEPQGLLRITAPVELGSTLLPAIVSGFASKFRRVTTELILTDRRVDLLAEGIDLAIRAGELKDSSLIAKKLGSVSFAPFSSVKYIKSLGSLSHPKDLSHAEWIRFTPLADRIWKLRNEKQVASLKTSGSLIANDLNMVKALATSGTGIAMLPTFFCFPEVRTGKLVRLLPGWTAEQNPVQFVYAAQKHVSPKLSGFIAFATEPLRKALTPF